MRFEIESTPHGLWAKRQDEIIEVRIYKRANVTVDADHLRGTNGQDFIHMTRAIPAAFGNELPAMVYDNLSLEQAAQMIDVLSTALLQARAKAEEAA